MAAAAGATEDIREGFLCPICVKDLGTVALLHEHFEQVHSNEDKQVVQSLKSLFGKAKRKILSTVKDDELLDEAGNGEAENDAKTFSIHFDYSSWEPQDLGAMRSYTESFKQVRDTRIDRFVIETNKLLIRLDKLLSPDAPTDHNKRKAYEKKVVVWAPDNDCRICMTCGKSFGVTRRRHHCRLCGGIMCNNCSQFLSDSFAKRLTNPNPNMDDSPFIPGFRRASSNSSLNSIRTAEGEGHTRTCKLCRGHLEHRQQQMEQRRTQPLICQLHEKLRKYMTEVEKILPQYMEIVESLLSGETVHTLEQAQGIRNTLLKLYDHVDILSKRIASLEIPADQNATKTAQLQRAVRMHASSFLQDKLLGLQALPDETQLLKLQEERREEVQRRITLQRAQQQETNRRLEEKLRNAQQNQPARTSPGARDDNIRAHSRSASDDLSRSRRETAWIPNEQHGSELDDPMVQQMNIVRGYIKQAKLQGRHDEVLLFEDNLKELQKEFLRQRDKAS